MRVLRAVQIWSRDVGGSLLTQDGFCEQIYSSAHDVQWTSVLRGPKRSVDSATSRKAKLFEMHRRRAPTVSPVSHLHQ